MYFKCTLHCNNGQSRDSCHRGPSVYYWLLSDWLLCDLLLCDWLLCDSLLCDWLLSDSLLCDWLMN